MYGVDGIVKLTDCRLSSAFLHEAKPLKLRRAAIDNLPGFQGESSYLTMPSRVLFTSAGVHQAPAEATAAGGAGINLPLSGCLPLVFLLTHVSGLALLVPRVLNGMG